MISMIITECVTLLLESKDALFACSDATLASRYVSILSSAYCALGEFAEAERACEESMKTLENSISVAAPVANQASSGDSKSSMAKSKTRLTGQTQHHQAPATESSYEIANALADVVAVWMNCIRSELDNLLTTIGIHHYKIPMIELFEKVWNRTGERALSIVINSASLMPLIILCREHHEID
jgi:hypothetical protein